MKYFNKASITALLFSVSMLTACGGGGGGSANLTDNSTPPATNPPVYPDAPNNAFNSSGNVNVAVVGAAYSVSTTSTATIDTATLPKIVFNAGEEHGARYTVYGVLAGALDGATEGPTAIEYRADAVTGIDVGSKRDVSLAVTILGAPANNNITLTFGVPDSSNNTLTVIAETSGAASSSHNWVAKMDLDSLKHYLYYDEGGETGTHLLAAEYVALGISYETTFEQDKLASSFGWRYAGLRSAELPSAGTAYYELRAFGVAINGATYNYIPLTGTGNITADFGSGSLDLVLEINDARQTSTTKYADFSLTGIGIGTDSTRLNHFYKVTGTGGNINIESAYESAAGGDRTISDIEVAGSFFGPNKAAGTNSGGSTSVEGPAEVAGGITSDGGSSGDDINILFIGKKD